MHIDREINISTIHCEIRGSPVRGLAIERAFSEGARKDVSPA